MINNKLFKLFHSKTNLVFYPLINYGSNNIWEDPFSWSTFFQSVDMDFQETIYTGRIYSVRFCCKS
jgi:hypothetical protein